MWAIRYLENESCLDKTRHGWSTTGTHHSLLCKKKTHVFYLTFPTILCGQKVNNTYARMDWQVTFDRKYFFFSFFLLQYITTYLNILYEYKAGLSDHLTFIVYGKYESLGIWRSSQLAISILSILAYVKLDIQMCECAAWMHDWVTWCLFEHTFTTFLLWWCHLKKSLSLWEKYNSEMILTPEDKAHFTKVIYKEN